MTTTPEALAAAFSAKAGTWFVPGWDGHNIAAELRRLATVEAERDQLHASCSKWVDANAPGGWIDQLRVEVERLRSQSQPQDAHTAAMRQALAYIRWQAFGECRSPGWDGPPPKAHEADAGLCGALGGATQDAHQAGWQPIETAPTGRIHSPPLRAIVSSTLDDGSEYIEEAWFDYERREWWPANVDSTDAHGAAVYPTRWMPLPAA